MFYGSALESSSLAFYWPDSNNAFLRSVDSSD